MHCEKIHIHRVIIEFFNCINSYETTQKEKINKCPAKSKMLNRNNFQARVVMHAEMVYLVNIWQRNTKVLSFLQCFVYATVCKIAQCHAVRQKNEAIDVTVFPNAETLNDAYNKLRKSIRFNTSPRTPHVC